MSTDPHNIPTSSSGVPLFTQEEPCYSKVANAGVVALGITRKDFQAIKQEMLWLHRLHMKLDAVVVAHQAEKSAGSSSSYIVVKVCETKKEAALAVCRIGEELLRASGEVSCIRALAGFGEVGFGILGSAGWSYQFYGDLIETLKREVLNCSPGKLRKLRELSIFLEEHEEAPSTSCGTEISEDVVSSRGVYEDHEVIPATFEEWRGRNLRHVEVWVLMITLLLSVLALLGAVEKRYSNKVPIIVFFIQLQCPFVNLWSLGVWLLNPEDFIKNHNKYMAIVWLSQLANRFVGSLFMPLATARLFHLPLPLRVIAANGPEKLLLSSTPLVNGWQSVVLHVCGTISSVILGIRSCSSIPEEITFVPSECRPLPWLFVCISNIIVFLACPLYYALRCHKQATAQYNQLKASKRLKQA